MAIYLLFSVIAGAVAFVATALVRRHAGRLGLVQMPNQRSSHTQPTPAGGGLGIALGATLGAGAIGVGNAPLLVVLAASLGVGVLGFIDDRRPLPASFRLATQLAIVGVAIWLALPPGVLARIAPVAPPVIILGLTAIAVYWLNIFNFMDGIDGLAGSEAVFLCLSVVLLAALKVPDAAGAPLFWCLIATAAATAGFLVHNWPPAKLFMGDAGSGFLGVALPLMAVLAVIAGWLTSAQCAILAAAFVSDATVTLLVRLSRGENVLAPHRRHAYQALSRRWQSHRRVTLAAIAVNVLWLLPLALLSAQPEWTLAALALAYLPLIAAVALAGAGQPERPMATGP